MSALLACIIAGIIEIFYAVEVTESFRKQDKPQGKREPFLLKGADGKWYRNPNWSDK